MKAPRKAAVLVVDNERNIAETLAMILEQRGYAAVFALSGQAALELASGIAVDVALLDVMLAGLDGIQTGVELRKRIPSCTVLLMSGDSESAPLLQKAKEEGISFDVLAKPVPPPELFSKLESIIAMKDRATV